MNTVWESFLEVGSRRYLKFELNSKLAYQRLRRLS